MTEHHFAASRATASPQLLTCQEVADRLAVCERTVRRAISSGALPVVRPGSRTIRIRQADLEAWLQPQKAQASGQSQ